jgi:hypothetical protein
VTRDRVGTLFFHWFSCDCQLADLILVPYLFMSLRCWFFSRYIVLYLR